MPRASFGQSAWPLSANMNASGRFLFAVIDGRYGKFGQHPTGILILRAYSQCGIVGLGIGARETIEECAMH